MQQAKLKLQQKVSSARIIGRSSDEELRTYSNLPLDLASPPSSMRAVHASPHVSGLNSPTNRSPVRLPNHTPAKSPKQPSAEIDGHRIKQQCVSSPVDSGALRLHAALQILEKLDGPDKPATASAFKGRGGRKFDLFQEADLILAVHQCIRNGVDGTPKRVDDGTFVYPDKLAMRCEVPATCQLTAASLLAPMLKIAIP